MAIPSHTKTRHARFGLGPNSPRSGTSAFLTFGTPVDNTVVVTASVPIFLSGVPRIRAQDGVEAFMDPTEVTLLSSTTFQLTYPDDINALGVFECTPLDPAIRTQTGGYAGPKHAAVG